MELDLTDGAGDCSKDLVGICSEFRLSDPDLWTLLLLLALYCCLTEALLAAAGSTLELDLLTLVTVELAGGLVTPDTDCLPVSDTFSLLLLTLPALSNVLSLT